MATTLRNIGEDQRLSTRGTEIMETNQQNHQTGIQSMTNSTSPESEQYRLNLPNPQWNQSLKDQRKAKSKMLQE